jgi:hypothetical protein
MDDYLSKPVDRGRLQDLVLAWTRRRSAAGRSDGDGSEADRGAAPEGRAAAAAAAGGVEAVGALAAAAAGPTVE